MQGPTEGGVLAPTDETLLYTLTSGIASLSYGETEGYDLEALTKFQSALTSEISDVDNSTPIMLEQAYDLMLTAIENSYLYGDLTHADGNYNLPKPEALVSTLNIINAKLSALNPQDAFYSYWNFKLHLDKALTYRNGGYYPEAMQILATEGIWATGQQLERTGYWNCICEAEKGYYDETVGPEEYTIALEICRSLYSGATYKRLPGTDQQKGTGYVFSEPDLVDGLKFYPQPVTGKLTLELACGFAGDIDYDITSTDGRMIRAGKLTWNGGSQNELDLENLQPGLYIITVQLAGSKNSFTISKH